MNRAFFSILYKDLRLMISGKFFLLSLSSLMIYTCYINFHYVNIDDSPYQKYIYYDDRTITLDTEAIEVDSYDKLIHMLEEDKEGIGYYIHEGSCDMIQYDSGLMKLNKFRYDASNRRDKYVTESKIVTVGELNREEKLRREMSCEVLFFEIVAIGFLGVAAILFKEKTMGTIRIHGIKDNRICDS